MELLYLADLVVKRTLGHQQDTELILVELSYPTLHLIFGGMLTNIVSLHIYIFTEALTLSKKVFSLTSSRTLSIIWSECLLKGSRFSLIVALNMRGV